MDVFAVVEVGGRPAAGVRAATRGEWSIGGLVLPVPGDMRRKLKFSYYNENKSNFIELGYPPVHINAALTFTIHFLGLLTFYLGVRLPFQITWSGGKLGVGIPEISAIKGADSGGWARYTKYSSFVNICLIYIIYLDGHFEIRYTFHSQLQASKQLVHPQPLLPPLPQHPHALHPIRTILLNPQPPFLLAHIMIL